MRAGRGRYSDMARSGSTRSYTPSVISSVKDEEVTVEKEPAKSFLEDYLDKNKEEVADDLKPLGVGMVYKGEKV